GVVVEVSLPATPCKSTPVESKMVTLSGVPGTAKFARFKTLKNPARNCTLKFSEIRLIELFLNTEKSRFAVPGPIRMLRPALPRRLKHWGGVPKLGSHDGYKAGLAVGIAKHWSL